MGLDMYLTKKTYVGANYAHNKITGKISIKKDGKPIEINLSRVTYIEERLGYWRKANQIHKWFVENVQEGEDNCKEYYVSTEQLQSLLYNCKNVLANKDKAETLLPTASGFFFGGTDYDDYYFTEIEDTIKICEQAVKEGGEIYYSSSW